MVGIALVHVLIPFCLCTILANSGLFDNVLVDLTYDHYAEKIVEWLPAFLAMPFNCLVNLGYIIMGTFWLLKRIASRDSRECYFKDVFALMAILYGPIQWIRLSSLSRTPAILDQWFTLPIFAWVPVWCHFIEHGWSPRYVLLAESVSILSYTLALFHDLGFETALAFHVAGAVLTGVRIQRSHGDATSFRYLVLAVLSCSGFVVLKLWDFSLAQYWLFQNLTGHFWSKICDILQFHFSFCFLTCLNKKDQKRT
ncbi:transmembrane protein 187 [Clupea harengus]|uniref:Transmembrane protein 187 n=1 Tax=Clupea harengus TaxID=7950 RepID=A0A8M1KF13_CLUHA|nr:transmembrane protein 187 [Clupea harengus]